MKQKPVRESGFSTTKTLLIAAGGTGGHITPAISIAEAWLAAGGSVVLATLKKNLTYPDIERLLLPNTKKGHNDRISVAASDAPRLTKNPLQWPRFVREFLAAYRLVRQAARAERADAVLGMGGYSSFPAVLYAILNRKALFLCEQNAHWGIVTRFARHFAKAVFLSFAAKKHLGKKYVVTGNPLRAMFAHEKARGRIRRKKKSIFFLGGSQGAKDINALYLAFAQHPASREYVALVAAGATTAAELKERARNGDTVLPFIKDMPSAYREADAIVARAGSGTLFEIRWAQKPAFLVPYPYAAADHQWKNALAIKEQIPCHIYNERPFRAESALPALLQFLKSPPAPISRQNSTRPEEDIIRYIVGST